MKIRYIALTHCDCAGYHGALCFELVLGGQLDISVHDAVMLIDNTIIDYGLKTPLILLDGRVPAEFDSEDVLEFATVMRSKGFGLIGKTWGSAYPRWFPVCSYHVAAVGNAAWMNFPVEELQYVPASEDALAEPFIQSCNVAALKVIQLAGKNPRPLTELFGFVAKAAYCWGILSPAKWEYHITLIKDN